MATVQEWLTGVSSPSVRLFVTAVALVAVAAGALAMRALRRRQGSGAAARGVTLLALAGYLALVGGAATAVLAVWGLAGTAERFLAGRVGRTLVLKTVLSLLTLAATYVLVGASRRVVGGFVESRLSLSTHEGELLFRAVQATLYGVVVLWLFSYWNVGLTNLLISAGVLGVVVGLAAQQTLGAVISGFVIMLSRPFEVGDYVRIGDRKGMVTDVTLVDTRLRTVDRERVSVPNDVVESGEVVNYSRDGRLRVSVPVTVDYDADLDRAVDVALEAVAGVDLAVEEPPPDYDARFGDSGLELELRFLVENPTGTRHWRARRDAVRAVKTAFDDAGIRIPYPQRELAARKERDGFHVRSERIDAEGQD